MLNFIIHPLLYLFQVQFKGMREETLDALGIMTPMHRSLLTYFEPRSYSNDIEVGTYSAPQTERIEDRCCINSD
jgi:hypothetical protein